MSLGSGYFDAPCDTTSSLTDIIEKLRSKQVATVVAAGNETFFDGISEPACISQAISVSALKHDGELDVSYSKHRHRSHGSHQARSTRGDRRGYEVAADARRECA